MAGFGYVDSAECEYWMEGSSAADDDDHAAAAAVEGMQSDGGVLQDATRCNGKVRDDKVR